MKTRPWLWVTYVWNMFDFSADERAEGDQFGRNDKGLVTYDRKTRKDAFYWYQANWTTDPMVHIVSKRFDLRSNPKTELRIYSNCEEVEAKLNGISLCKTTSTDCRFIWPEIELKPGPNRLEAFAYRGGKVWPIFRQLDIASRWRSVAEQIRRRGRNRSRAKKSGEGKGKSRERRSCKTTMIRLSSSMKTVIRWSLFETFSQTFGRWGERPREPRIPVRLRFSIGSSVASPTL